MTYIARVPDRNEDTGFTVMDVTERFGEASSLEDAADIMQQNGYHAGTVFSKDNSPEVLSVLESGHGEKYESEHVIHLEDF